MQDPSVLYTDIYYIYHDYFTVDELKERCNKNGQNSYVFFNQIESMKYEPDKEFIDYTRKYIKNVKELGLQEANIIDRL